MFYNIFAKNLISFITTFITSFFCTFAVYERARGRDCEWKRISVFKSTPIQKFHFIIKALPFALFPYFLFVGAGIKLFSCSDSLFHYNLSPLSLALSLSLCICSLKCCLFYCHFPLYPASAIYSSFYTEINGQWTDFIRNNRVSHRPLVNGFLPLFFVPLFHRRHSCDCSFTVINVCVPLPFVVVSEMLWSSPAES